MFAHKHKIASSSDFDLDRFVARQKRDFKYHSYIEFRKLNDQAFDKVCELLPEYKDFETLSIIKCLTDKRLEKLSTALSSVERKLKTLMIRSDIDASNISSLIELVKNNPSIKILSLDQCNLDVKAIGILADYLKENNQVVELDLIDCQIKDDGAERLAIGLRSNQSVTKVDLSRNPISEEMENALKQDSAISAEVDFIAIVMSSAETPANTANILRR